MSPRPLLTFVGTALACAALAGCSSVKANAKWDSSVDFSKYKTYAFSKEHTLDDEYRQAKAERTIADALAAKGFRLDNDHPQLILSLYPLITSAITGSLAPAGSLAWKSWGPPVGAEISTGGQSSASAAVALFIREAQTDRLVWAGMATGSANLDDRDLTTRRVVGGIQMMLAKFPPPKE